VPRIPDKNLDVVVYLYGECMPVRASAAEPGRVYRKIAYGPLVDVFMLDMRDYRGPNRQNKQTRYGLGRHFLGRQQAAWQGELEASKAT
jgi:alkaline phosphatase D